MKNSYIISFTIVAVAILGFVLAGRKTEAPMEKESVSEKEQVATNFEGNANFTDGKYALDTSSSKILWEGEYLTGLKENGTVMLKSGEVTVEKGIIKSGSFVIDMNTIESIPHKDRLVSHLKNDDFFSVDTYPTATFVFKNITPTSEVGAEEGRFVIAGDLTVRGITKPISFMVTLSGSDEAIMARASFAINRADWEIKYNSPTFFGDLGEKIIRDAVSIGLDLKAYKVIE